MGVLLQIQGAEKSFGEQMLLDNAEATITDNVKVGFVGRNGAGKSTLLRILLDEEELEKGEVIRHPALQIGYLRQHDPFLPGESALEFLMRDSGQPDWKCGEVGGEFELEGKYLSGPVAELSGGWQTRVKLAALLLHEPNLLLLDEPTNFLDLRTQILLEHFLRSFTKAALIVSHDRAFLQATCDHTLDLTRGKLTMYPGKIEEFLVFQAERREQDERENATVLAKQKQLQKFIDKNRARASTASRARSKGRMLDRLQTVDIKGTVLFTSHDRHFMRRVATGIVEVRDGSAKNYGGDYDAYLYYINKEIEDGERDRAPARAKPPKEKAGSATPAAKAVDHKRLQKELKTLEKTVVSLDEQRRMLHDQLMKATDPAEALRLHNDLKAVEMDLGAAEERWLELNALD